MVARRTKMAAATRLRPRSLDPSQVTRVGSEEQRYARKGLLVLFEGLDRSVIDAQVLSHVRSVRSAHIAEIEVWCFASWRSYWSSLRRREEARSLATGEVRVFRAVRAGIPFSSFINRVLLALALRRAGVPHDFIHARTDYATVVCGLGSRRTFTLIWDCRGDAEAEERLRWAEAGRPWGPVGRLWAWRARKRQSRASRTCDKAIFVSDELKRRTAWPGCKPTEVIPSTASADFFYFDPELRSVARSDLGFAHGDKVLVYSGSLAVHQGFDRSISLFAALRNHDPSWQFLVLTPETETAGRMLSHLPSEAWQVRTPAFTAVNVHLNAADCALLLRSDNPVNWSASPTKFPEYSLAGLPVIVGPGARQTLALGRRLDCIIPYGPGFSPQSATVWTDEERQHAAGAARVFLSRDSTLERYRRLYAS